jgi:hypothetical protein
VAGLRAAQWTAPTPCTELDVRDVVNHLVSENLLFGRHPAAGRGYEPGEGWPAGFRRTQRPLPGSARQSPSASTTWPRRMTNRGQP